MSCNFTCTALSALTADVAGPTDQHGVQLATTHKPMPNAASVQQNCWQSSPGSVLREDPVLQTLWHASALPH